MAGWADECVIGCSRRAKSNGTDAVAIGCRTARWWRCCSSMVLCLCHQSKQLDRFRDRFTVAGARMIRRENAMSRKLAAHRSGSLSPACCRNPAVIRAAEWSRPRKTAAGAYAPCKSPASAIVALFIRRPFKLTDDVAERLVSGALAEGADPTVRPSSEKEICARPRRVNRIRRLDAAAVLKILREPRCSWRLAQRRRCAHISSLAARLHLVNQQIKEAQQNLDSLCVQMKKRCSRQNSEQCDVTIFAPGQESADQSRHKLLAEATEPASETTTPCRLAGVAR